MKYSSRQQEVIRTKGNLVVSASAGSGKTATMVKKIISEIEENSTHQVIAAVTFTIKAAQEIKDRIKINANIHFIGTNNSFAIEEIIKPFIKDVYGSEYNQDLNTDYSCRIDNFSEGLERIKEDALLCSFNDNRKNFIFELALDILKKSKACKLYLKAKYFKIYIDEYQDCDKDMHKLFMYICDTLKIETFVVGDEKQSIYMWRGAFPMAFRGLWGKENFKHLVMEENYRSCMQIQNYSNILCENTRHLYKPLAVNGHIELIVCDNNIKQITQKITASLDVSKNFALLRHTRANTKRYAQALRDNGIDCVYIPPIPIAEITTRTAWLYMAIAKFIVLKRYSVYDFYYEIPAESSNDKHRISEIEEKLKAIESQKNNKENLRKEVEKFADYLGYESKESHIDKLFDTLNNRECHVAFELEKQQNVAITFHSSKGLEYDQVVVFAEDYTLFNEESIYNHYVAVTRAKSKVIIVYEKNRAVSYRTKLQELLKSANLDFKDVVDIVR